MSREISLPLVNRPPGYTCAAAFTLRLSSIPSSYGRQGEAGPTTRCNSAHSQQLFDRPSGQKGAGCALPSIGPRLVGVNASAIGRPFQPVETAIFGKNGFVGIVRYADQECVRNTGVRRRV